MVAPIGSVVQKFLSSDALSNALAESPTAPHLFVVAWLCGDISFTCVFCGSRRQQNRLTLAANISKKGRQKRMKFSRLLEGVDVHNDPDCWPLVQGVPLGNQNIEGHEKISVTLFWFDRSRWNLARWEVLADLKRIWWTLVHIFGEHKFSIVYISDTSCRIATKFCVVRGLANGHFFPEFGEIWFWGPAMPCSDMLISVRRWCTNIYSLTGEAIHFSQYSGASYFTLLQYTIRGIYCSHLTSAICNGITVCTTSKLFSTHLSAGRFRKLDRFFSSRVTDLVLHKSIPLRHISFALANYMNVTLVSIIPTIISLYLSLFSLHRIQKYCDMMKFVINSQTN